MTTKHDNYTPYMLQNFVAEPCKQQDGLMTHQEFLTVLKNKDCHKCPLYKWWGIEEEDDESICYMMHHLKAERRWR